MSNEYGATALLEFLGHAADRGLMPAATAQALGVACRNIFQVLEDEEKADLRALDLDAVVKRFSNRRAHDFNPRSLREYGRRLKRAVEIFIAWRTDPAGFSVQTRAPKRAVKSGRGAPPRATHASGSDHGAAALVPVSANATVVPLTGTLTEVYNTSFPVRPGMVVTLMGVPADLTSAEAERLAGFVKVLAVAGER